MSASPLQFRIAEIDARRSSHGAIIECLRFDAEARGTKPTTILAVAEIHSTVYAYERLLDTVHASINQARTLVSKIEGDPMIRFEKIIQKVNEALSAFAGAEASPIQWPRVNLFIFQLSEDHLCFSGVGWLTNAFLQQQENGTTKTFDLLGSLEQPDPIDPRKPLGSIVCGSMNAGDVLFVGTQNLQEIREKIELIRLCQEHPPVSAATEIQQRLQALRSLESYFGVVMAGVTLTAPKPAPVPKTFSLAPEPEETLIEEETGPMIHETEQETERILEEGSPDAGARLQELFSSVKNSVSDLFKRDPRPEGIPGSTSDASLSPLSLAGLRGMNAGYARGLWAEKRQLVMGIGVGILLLIGGGMWFQHARALQAEQRLWKTIYDQAVAAKNRSEDALVYNDEEKAQAQFVQAQNGLNQLDEKTKDRAQARATLAKDLDALRARLRKEISLTNPTLIADLHTLNNSTSVSGLFVQNGTLFTLDKTQNQAVLFPLTNGSSTRINAPENATLLLQGPGPTQPFFLTNSGLYTSRGGTLASVSTTTAAHVANLRAFTVYGKRLYGIDPTNGMIWRYSASASALSGESAYLSAPADEAKQGAALAIDSSVYLLSDDGRITKFTSGKRDAWRAATIDPPLQNGASLWTDAVTKNLIVADTKGKRVVVFDKTGKLVEQITSPQFQGPTAVWGDSATSALYILDGTRLYKTNLP